MQTGGVSAQTKLQLNTGEEIFKAACIACHGDDGKGTPQTTAGFERPATFPDFTDCSGTTPEPNADWRSIIHRGGPVRGFSEIMPSFTEALTRTRSIRCSDTCAGCARTAPGRAAK